MSQTTDLISDAQSTDLIDDAESVAPSRPAVIRVRGNRRIPTDSERAELLDYLAAGRSVAAYLRDNPSAPSYAVWMRLRLEDDNFGKAFEAARHAGIDAMLEESQDFARAARTDKSLAIAADRYANTIQKTAALLAPKQYGAMLKLAGHDGEALTVSVVSYKDQPAIEAGKVIDVTDTADSSD